MYLISSCLFGNNCKYNGGNNYNEKIIEFCKNHEYFLVCPESAAGLSMPRDPAEQVGDKVIDKSGKDLTVAFVNGAKISYKNAIEYAKDNNTIIEGAILKANSPSCGCGQIYDGTFSGTLKEGDGCFTKLLKVHNIPVYTEKDDISIL